MLSFALLIHNQWFPNEDNTFPFGSYSANGILEMLLFIQA